MGENSKIEWTQNTGSPWLGCTEVSPGCINCYARELTQTRLEPIMRKAYKAAGFDDWETRPVWGEKATRVVTKGFWTNALSANRRAAKEGVRVKHFPSLDDFLDECPAGIVTQEGKEMEPISVLADLLKLIYDTPNLDWLLLTKRPENFESRTCQAIGNDLRRGNRGLEFNRWLSFWSGGIKIPNNIWIGTTVEDQKRADERIPELLKIPAKVRFLSVEPQLEDITWSLARWLNLEHRSHQNRLGEPWVDDGWHPAPEPQLYKRERIHWIINGFESGPKKRPGNLAWMRSIRDQCKAAGVAYFCKQIDKVQQIPEDLMIREFPQA